MPTATNRYLGNIGLYIGNNQFIHAKFSLGKVTIENFFADDYLEIFIGYKDLVSYILQEELNNSYQQSFK